jgi:ubiquinone/menaquinone biosynthesis C-methylase UbiE
MVTDINSSYTSPAGKEFTLIAGRFAGITPGSRVLDAGCGFGAGISNLAENFRCQATAIDINGDNLKIAKASAEGRKVSHLINFVEGDVLESIPQDEKYDLILAEGGILSILGREKGLEFFNKHLAPSGWLAFSDLIMLTNEANIPNDVLHIFDHKQYQYESENSYRKILNRAGFEIQLMSLVPPSGWDNYYAHMSRRIEDESGFFADRQVKQVFHREIDIFYRLEGFRYIGYLFTMVRKRDI